MVQNTCTSAENSASKLNEIKVVTCTHCAQLLTDTLNESQDQKIARSELKIQFFSVARSQFPELAKIFELPDINSIKFEKLILKKRSAHISKQTKDGKIISAIKVKVQIEDSSQKRTLKPEDAFINCTSVQAAHKIQQISKKDPIVAQMVAHNLMNKPIQKVQQQKSDKLKKQIRTKANKNAKSVQGCVQFLTDCLQKTGIHVLMCDSSTAQSQLSLKSLTEGFMANKLRVNTSCQINDPSCPYVFEDLCEQNQFSQFKKWFQVQTSQQTGLAPERIVVHEVCKTDSDQTVKWSTDDSDALLQKLQSKPSLKSKYIIHPFFRQFHLSPEDFDAKGNLQFPSSQTKIDTRGGLPYYQPEKGTRYGLNVSKKYDNGDDRWLEMNGNPGEWCIGFHGVKAPRSFIDGTQTKVFDSIFKGNGPLPQLTQGSGQQHQSEKPANGDGKDVVGKSVYFSPHIQVCLTDYTSTTDEYALVFQARLNPKKVKICSSKNKHWVVNDPADIRPYGMILIDNKIRNQYRSITQQFGKQFQYSDYKQKHEQYIKSYQQLIM